MSKKKQEDAKEKAQKQVQQSSGGGGGNNSGRNNSGGGGGGGGGNNSGGGGSKGNKIVATSSGAKGKLDNKGRLIPGSSAIGVGLGAGYRDNGRLNPTKQSSKKLNNYLDKTGYSLRGGDGRTVVGFKTVKTAGYSSPFANIGSGGVHIPGGKETVAIYGPSKKERRESGGRSSGSQSGRSSAPSSSGSGAPSAVSRTRQYAEDRIYGRVPEGIKPPMFPEGVQVQGRAPEAVADYSDRLDTYNQNLHGWMNDRAVASQYESGQFLRNFAAGLPPAPDVMSTDEMFRTARRFSNINYT
jgi:hypothetical protein